MSSLFSDSKLKYQIKFIRTKDQEKIAIGKHLF